MAIVSLYNLACGMFLLKVSSMRMSGTGFASSNPRPGPRVNLKEKRNILGMLGKGK